jgi:uncharacterized membrane protein YphA (DoxX/SURF4 family)
MYTSEAATAPAEHSTLSTSTGATAAPPWPAPVRVAFRVVFVYVGLYLLGGWLFPIPVLEKIGGWYSSASESIELWVGRHAVGITGPIDVHTLGTGSGDTMLAYLDLVWQPAVACAVALIWTILSRRTEYTRLHQWLRVYVRYSLAVIMLTYGFGKVFFPGQFAPPTLDRLIEPFGHASPMGLLWTFMGASHAYTTFTGAVEVLGGLLLFAEQTTLLGALVVAAAMGNVAILNFSYDVPVKLYSTHLFLLAVLLIVPEVPRLGRVFITNRVAEPAPRWQPFARAWTRRVAFAAKWILVLALLWSSFQPELNEMRQPPPARSPRYGIWEVQSFVANGESRPATPMDPKVWRRVIFNEFGRLSVQTLDDGVTHYRTKEDKPKHTFELSTIYSPYDKIALSYREPADGQLVLEGLYGGEALTVTLRKVPLPSFLLNDRGFHWISEYPYNR